MQTDKTDGRTDGHGEATSRFSQFFERTCKPLNVSTEKKILVITLSHTQNFAYRRVEIILSNSQGHITKS